MSFPRGTVRRVDGVEEDRFVVLVLIGVQGGSGLTFFHRGILVVGLAGAVFPLPAPRSDHGLGEREMLKPRATKGFLVEVEPAPTGEACSLPTPRGSFGVPFPGTPRTRRASSPLDPGEGGGTLPPPVLIPRGGTLH